MDSKSIRGCGSIACRDAFPEYSPTFSRTRTEPQGSQFGSRRQLEARCVVNFQCLCSNFESLPQRSAYQDDCTGLWYLGITGTRITVLRGHNTESESIRVNSVLCPVNYDVPETMSARDHHDRQARIQGRIGRRSAPANVPQQLSRRELTVSR